MQKEVVVYETTANFTGYSRKISRTIEYPLEQLMHMPQHILLQKLAELNAGEDKKGSE